MPNIKHLILSRILLFLSTSFVLAFFYELIPLGVKADKVFPNNPSNITRKADSLLTAETISYNETDEIITAEGNVVVSQESRVLHADKIMYYRKLDTIVAVGNVYLEEPTGEVLFVQYLELKDSFKEGIAHQIRMILSDNSKLAATKVTRSKGVQNEFERVVYSPCKLCKVDPNRPPLWQIKARHVLWDQEEKTVEYTDANMEFMGVPVFYTPYFRHPDPTVKKKSGFLTPSIGGGSDIGAAIVLPYFYNIAPHKDLTLTPIIGSKTQIMMAQYRQRFSKGIMDLTVSGAQVSQKRSEREDRTHWHIDTMGEYHFNQHWRLGANVLRSSDRNYVRRYPELGVTSRSVLTSKAYAEGFYQQTYFHVQGLSFQGLRTQDNQKMIPLVAPLVDINYKSGPCLWHSWFTTDFNGIVLTREQGTNTRRFSVKQGWHIPYQSCWGDLYQLDFIFRVDGYNVDCHPIIGENRTVNASEGRVFPQVALHWWYPFINNLNSCQILVTPKASLVGSPNFGRRKKIPNEDSRIFELSDTNIMDNNRQTGYDHLDVGSRVNYGAEFSLFGFGAGPSSLFIGQSYNFHNPRNDLVDTGVHQGSSDYVIRAQILPMDILRFRYRSRLGRKHLNSRRSEISAIVGPPILQGRMDYISIAKPTNPLSDEQGGEQIYLALSSEFVKNWTATIDTTRELGAGGGALAQSVGLKYQDECFIFRTSIKKTFYRDRDIRPGVVFWFSLEFKNLGSVSYNISQGGTTRDDKEKEEDEEETAGMVVP